MENIRRLTAEDSGEYHKLLTSLVRELDPSAPKVTESYLASGLSDPSNYFFAAHAKGGEEDGAVVGMGMVAFRWRVQGRLAEIHSMIVYDDYRGAKIGARLLDELMRVVEERVNKHKEKILVQLSVRPNREAANRLYVKRGFKLQAASVGGDGKNFYEMEVMPNK